MISSLISSASGDKLVSSGECSKKNVDIAEKSSQNVEVEVLDPDPLAQFDRFVLASCISEWAKENQYTTPNIIYRHLTGKIENDSEAPSDAKDAILKSICRLMCT